MVELFIILDIVKYCEFKIVLRMLILIDGKLKKVIKKIIYRYMDINVNIYVVSYFLCIK